MLAEGGIQGGRRGYDLLWGSHELSLPPKELQPTLAARSPEVESLGPHTASSEEDDFKYQVKKLFLKENSIILI